MLRMSEVNAVDHQAMQHMLSSGSVKWAQMGNELAAQANALLGGERSVFIIDESAFAKKGMASAGVARQWNGRLGKVDNSQVGVFAALCRGEMATLVDARLYLPQKWLDEPERCEEAAIPEAERVYRSKSALALALVDDARRRGMCFGYAAVDGGYGKEPAFLRGLDERKTRFVADVHKDQTIYLEDPRPAVAQWKGRGRRPQRLETAVKPVRVDAWAQTQAASDWQRLTLREGEKGDIEAEYLHARIWVWDGEEAQAHCWHLMVRRERGASIPSHYCLSNAPQETELKELARVQGQRFFIEHAFRETKSECGMADYQVRRWDAWHHHMALVMLATLFLVKQKLAHRETWPMLSLNDLVTAMAHMLPRRQMSAAELADIIARRHHARHAAKQHHVRKKQNSPPVSPGPPDASGEI